ncbi:hypothetical protein [Actinoplanes siamensis]|uniref:Uncharacterized protein n=1 Tax=Actinoplanes siamensis TaxID=1223317 RepID=A0A919TMY2_9ACTN|nr:hypothetical protein [Actinoplanes siamensis]GIF08049.1 hypothetical protein Asi03nite_55870 [Actinoplanes siamensis]
MSYAAVPPVTAPAPPSSGRPPAVTAASALLWLMGAAGLVYAIVTVAIAPGTVSRFRDAAGGAEADNFVTVVWLDAALAAVLSILFFALFVVLGLGLRRGSRVARVASLVFCVLGVLGGLGSFVTVLAQRSGDPVPGSISDALGSAYPDGWIGLNVVVTGLQVLAYLAVGAMLLAAPRTFFGYAPQPSPAGPPFGPHGAPGHPGFAQRPGPFGAPGAPGAFHGGPGAHGVPIGSPYAPPPGAPFGSPSPTSGAPYGAASGTPSSAHYGAAPGSPSGAPFGAAPGSPVGAPFGTVPGAPPAAPPGATSGAPSGAPHSGLAAGGSPTPVRGYAPPMQTSPYASAGPSGFAPPVPPSAHVPSPDDLSAYPPPGSPGAYPPVGGFPAASPAATPPAEAARPVPSSPGPAPIAPAEGSRPEASSAVGSPTGGPADHPSTERPPAAQQWAPAAGDRSPTGVTEGSGSVADPEPATESGQGHIGEASRPGDRAANRPAPGSDDEYWRRPPE